VLIPTLPIYPEPRTAEETAHAGFLDAVVHRVVYGWAYDAIHPNRTLAVEVTINNVFAGRAPANVFRKDLRDAGIGDGLHAFEFAVPAGIESVDTVEAHIAGTAHRLTASTPEPIHAALNRPLPAEWRPVRGRHAYPNFFILGAAKSGTTSLHYYLSECQGVLVSNPKEPYFFEAQHQLGAAHYFNKYFGGWNGERAVGEARHRNLYQPHVPRRIHRYNPDARLIVILRNPVERAISHWWHWYSVGAEKLSLQAALTADLRRIQDDAQRPADHPWQEHYVQALNAGREAKLRTYLDSGYYMRQMERYIELFGAERVHTILFDDLVADPALALASTLRFLGLDEGQAARIAYPVCNRSPVGMLDHVNGELLDWLRGHYASHNRRLEQFLGRPLDAWEEPFKESIASAPALTARECRYESRITSQNI
jgi:hypothetical protein